MSARCTISVLAVGMSRPDSMIVGRQQHVVFAVVEGRHDVFERGRRHLPVRDARRASPARACRRNSLASGEVLDARADIERLAAAIALAQQRLAHDQRIERRDEGAHREAVDRRRSDDREVAHAGERELQGARDRRRGERQHMHLGAQLLELLLVRDAEMLLLVDDHEAEVLELDGLAEQRMGADDDIDLAVGEALLAPCASSWRGTRRDACADLDREAVEALGEGLGSAGAPAAWSAPPPRPACRSSRRRRPRATPPRSCRSRRRRRPGGPSAGPTPGR